MDTLIYKPTAEQVARALLDSGSYLVKDMASILNEEGWFTWKSGIKAPVYTNCRYLMGHRGPNEVVIQSLASSIKSNFPDVNMIVGLESAGIHWSSTVASVLHLPTGFVRKAPKEYGADEGLFVGSSSIEKGTKAVIVDDLMASGGSVEKAISALKSKGVIVIGIQSIVNWNFSHMKERFRNLDVMVRTLVSYPHLLEEALRRDVINSQIKEELMFFYRNPKKHIFDFSFLLNNNKYIG